MTSLVCAGWGAWCWVLTGWVLPSRWSFIIYLLFHYLVTQWSAASVLCFGKILVLYSDQSYTFQIWSALTGDPFHRAMSEGHSLFFPDLPSQVGQPSHLYLCHTCSQSSKHLLGWILGTPGQHAHPRCTRVESYGTFVMVGKWSPKVRDPGLAPKVGLLGVGGTIERWGLVGCVQAIGDMPWKRLWDPGLYPFLHFSVSQP